MQIKILGSRVEIRLERRSPVTLTGLAAAAVIVLVLSDRPVSRDRLKEVLWEDLGSQRSSSLRNILSALASHLGRDRLLTDKSGYRLRLEPQDYVDIRVARAVKLDAQRCSESDPETAAFLYQYVCELWGTPPLDGLPTTRAMEEIRTRLIDLYLNTVEAHAEVLLRLCRPQDVVEMLQPMVASAPHREELRRLLMWALYLAGRGAGEALPLYESYAWDLAEVGAEPSDRLREMYEQIRIGDKRLYLDPPTVPENDRLVAASGARPDILVPMRMHDHVLGGPFNTAKERAHSKILLAVLPEVSELSVLGEAWAFRAVHWAAQRGIRQFIDIGAGLHMSSPYAVHSALRTAAPTAKVVYTHPDSTIVGFCKSRFPATESVHYVHASMEVSPEAFFGHPEIVEHLDLAQPTMYLMREEEANFSAIVKAKVTAIRKVMAAGSCLVLTRVLDDISDLVAEQLSVIYGGPEVKPLVVASMAEMTDLFDGLELVAGVDDVYRLLTEVKTDREPGQFRIVGGLGLMR